MAVPFRVRFLYWIVFVACVAPLAGMTWQMAPLVGPLIAPDLTFDYDGGLGANPTESLIHETGRTALVLLLATLAVTPIRRLTGWHRIQIVRRMLGVWSFVYALFHVAAYAGLNQLGDLSAIVDDVLNRRFIFVGMLAFTVLTALAATSTNGMMRRLGKRWQTLHRFVYLAGTAAIVHFTWGQKADIREPLQWGAFLALLFALRLFYWWRKRAAMAVTR